MTREIQPPPTPTMRVLLYCFPSFVSFFFWMRERLTLGGAAILVAMLVCTPAILQTEPSLVHLFSALAAMLLVTATLSYWFQPRLQVRSKAPVRCMRGEWFTVEVWITNLSTWSAYELQIDLLDASRSWEICDAWPSFDMLAPGETVRCTLKIRPQKRGQFAMPAIRVVTTFPLHLIRRRVVFAAVGEINIYPQFAEHGAMELSELSQGAAGMERENAQLSRGSSEYLGNREYQVGVPVRRWDYASWARLGRPIVREYLDVQPATATIIVDTCHPAANHYGELPTVEAALSIAAKLADSLINSGWSVDRLLLGLQLLQAPAQTNALSIESLLDACASATAFPEEKFGEFSEQVELCSRQESTTFLILNQWNGQRRQLCDSLRAIGVDCHGWVITEGQASIDSRELDLGFRQIPLAELNQGTNNETTRLTGARA